MILEYKKKNEYIILFINYVNFCIKYDCNKRRDFNWLYSL